MAIESFKIIDVEEYSNWDGFDEFMGNKPELIQNQTSYMNEAITTASSQLDILSGNRLGKEFKLLDEENDKQVINDVKLACCLQVRFLLRKGIEYLESNGNSVSSSALNYTINENDTFAPRPEVIQLLKKHGYFKDILYINNSNEGASYNNKHKIPPVYTDGTHRGLTYSEASGYFIKKVGGIVSDTGTIDIKDAPRPSDNGVSVSIDLTTKAIKMIAPEVANYVIPVLVQDKEFQELVKQGIDTYLEKNKETIGESAGKYLLDNERFITNLANNQAIQDKVKEVVESLEPQIQENTKEALLNDQDWLDEVVSNVPPISQESFNTLLSTSELYKNLSTELQKQKEELNKLKKQVLKKGMIIALESNINLDPNYWKERTDIPMGYGLVKGNGKLTVGENLEHSHDYEFQIYTHNAGGSIAPYQGIAGANLGQQEWGLSSKVEIVGPIKNSGGSANLGAGYGIRFWEYIYSEEEIEFPNIIDNSNIEFYTEEEIRPKLVSSITMFKDRTAPALNFVWSELDNKFTGRGTYTLLEVINLIKKDTELKKYITINGKSD